MTTTKKSKQTETETTTKEALKLELTFDVDASKDFLRTVFVNGVSIKDIITDGDDKKSDSEIETLMKDVGEILMEVSKLHDGLSPTLVNEFLLKNYKKYSLKLIITTAMTIGKLAIDKNDTTKLMFMINLMDFDSLTKAVIDFSENKMKDVRESREKDGDTFINGEHELTVLTYIGSVVEIAS